MVAAAVGAYREEEVVEQSATNALSGAQELQAVQQRLMHSIGNHLSPASPHPGSTKPEVSRTATKGDQAPCAHTTSEAER